MKTLEYIGEYKKSVFKQNDLYPRHSYTITSPSVEGSFDIDSESGRVVMMALYYLDDKKDMTKDDSQEYANKLAAKYIDVDKYSCDVKEISDVTITCYQFTYSRKLNGLEVNSKFVVNVAIDGSVSFIDYSASRVDEAIEKISDDQLNEMVKALGSEENYQKVYDMCVAEYSNEELIIDKSSTIKLINVELKDKGLVLVDNDSFGMKYVMSVDFDLCKYSDDGSCLGATGSGEYVEFLVVED